MHPLASRLSCRRPAPPLGPTGSGNSPTGSGRPVQIHGYDAPLAIAVESVHGTVGADIHSESTGFATRPEPEVVRPETEIAPVASPSFGDIAAVSSGRKSGSEAGVEAQSGYPLPAR